MANTVPTGAILAVLITILVPVSGAHLNPAVTLVFAVRRMVGWKTCGLYWAVQVIGGMIGTVLAHLMFEVPVVSTAQQIRSGGAQWLSESVATFGLVLVILGGLAVRRRAVPLLAGLYITAAYWFTASTSFAHPAVTIARSLTDSFAGIRLTDTPAFIAAQCVGALVAAAVPGWVWRVPPE